MNKKAGRINNDPDDNQWFPNTDTWGGFITGDVVGGG